ncbi:hypothetical protein FOH38_03280 [Lysinibacillus fusiformis]|nr:hypothetical protein FOH38_03280 [Lysinibacillus fusiformis]
MGRLARSTKGLYTLTEQLKEKGVEFVSIIGIMINQNLSFLYIKGVY